MNTIDNIQTWHSRARPLPDAKAFNVQLGCHIEEFVEMLESLHFTDPHFGTSAGGDIPLLTELGKMADALKDGVCSVEVVDRQEFLDSLADQIVTAVGTGYCAGMQTAEATRRVDESNWSKFVDGQPVFDENGKIAKPPTYRKPDLTGLY